MSLYDKFANAISNPNPKYGIIRNNTGLPILIVVVTDFKRNESRDHKIALLMPGNTTEKVPLGRGLFFSSKFKVMERIPELAPLLEKTRDIWKKFRESSSQDELFPFKEIFASYDAQKSDIWVRNEKAFILDASYELFGDSVELIFRDGNK
jgi:hypothetical protein